MKVGDIIMVEDFGSATIVESGFHKHLITVEASFVMLEDYNVVWKLSPVDVGIVVRKVFVQKNVLRGS